MEQLSFGSISSEDLQQRLETVLETEGISLSEETITTIVSRADGCLRDALKLAQMASVDEESLQQLGQLDLERLAALTLRRLAEGDLSGALRDGQLLLQTSQTHSGDPAAGLQAMAEQLAHAHLLIALGDDAPVRLGEETRASLQRVVRHVDAGRLHAWTSLLWEAWGRAKGALLRADALMVLTLVQMTEATGQPVEPSAAPSHRPMPTTAPKAKPVEILSDGNLLEGMIAATEDLNLKGLLRRPLWSVTRRVSWFCAALRLRHESASRRMQRRSFSLRRAPHHWRIS